MILTHFTSRRECLRVHEPSKLMEWFILSSYEAFRVSRVNFEKKLQSRFEQIFNELCTRVIYNNAIVSFAFLIQC